MLYETLEITTSSYAMLINFKLYIPTLLFDFPKIWQNFPDEQLKIIRKKTEFDTKLKKFFLDDLAEHVNCNRLLCPAR